MNIYLCEDDDVQRNLYKQMIDRQATITLNETCHVLDYARPDELLKSISGDDNIYFIDIELNASINGVELSKRIRQVDILGSIIFLTSRREYLPLAVNSLVMPVAYLVKSDFTQQATFNKELTRIFVMINHKDAKIQQQLSSSNDRITINSATKQLTIDPNLILYCEKIPRRKKVKITLSTEIVYTNLYLKDLKVQLTTTNFCDIFSSYIININHIEKIDTKQGEVLFDNQQTLLVSPRFATRLRKFMQEMHLSE